MTLGRELGERAAVFASLGIGAASASCYQLARERRLPGAPTRSAPPSSSSGLATAFAIAPRTLLSLKALGGFTDLSPGPVAEATAPCPTTFRAPPGRRARLDYDTRLDHFAVGLNLLGRHSLARYTTASGASSRSGSLVGVHAEDFSLRF